MKPKNVFFSWQADTPTRIGRNFLKEVLEEVCHGISSDTNVDDAIRDMEVDSDTQGVAGQAPVVDTIFKKIDISAVVIADMTFVGKRTKGGSMPNSNVLIEYGWALKGLGYQRVICVMNIAYGEPTIDNLPFNLRHIRWPICYNLPDDATAEIKAREKQKLVAILNDAIRSSLSTVPAVPIEPPPKFPATMAKDGPARFRKKGEALGFEDDFGWSEASKEVFLSDGPAMWLRVMPMINPKEKWPTHKLREAATQNSSTLLPLLNGSGGYSYLRAADGIGIYRVVSESKKDSQPDSIKIASVAFAFETGEIWSIDTAWMTFDKDKLPFVEKYFTEGIKQYAQFLKLLGVNPPYRWVAGMAGIKGRRFYYPVQPGYQRVGPGPLCAADIIEDEGQYDGKQNAATALLPFFEKFFEKCGLPRPAYLSQ